MSARRPARKRTLTRGALTFAAALSCALPACSSEESPTDTGVAQDPDSGVVVADDAEVPDTGRRDSGPRDSGPRADSGPADSGEPPPTDGNDSFQEAVEVPFGSGAGTQAALNPVDDHDFYRFTAPANTFILIAAAATAQSEENIADTVITLYDDAMNKLAENDDVLAPVTRSTNSEIVYYVPAETTFFLEIQEWSTWSMQKERSGGPGFTYRVSVIGLADSNNGVVIDPETGDDAASAVPIEFGRNASFILGTWTDPADVDVYRLSVRGSETVLFTADLLGFGPEAQGSTSPAGLVWLTDVTGSTITARIDNAVPGLDALSPPIDPGEYLLWVGHPAGALGANDFYVIKPSVGGENPLETGDPMNDTLDGAEPLAQAKTTTPGVRAAYILARLPEGDVDYFSFDVLEMEKVDLVCAARFVGSGTRDLQVEVRDGSDSVIATVTEPADGTAFLEAVTVTSTGTHYLRLAPGAQDAEVTGDFVRCAVRTVIE